MPRAELSADEIAAAKQKHGELAVVETVLGTCLFRPPTRAEYDEFMRMLLHAQQKLDALYWLASVTVVVPDRPTFDAWVERRPGLPKAAETAMMLQMGIDPSAHGEDDVEGDTTTVQTPEGPMTFGVPDRRQSKDFSRRVDSEGAPKAAEWLALATVRSPTREALAAILERRPGIGATVAPHIQRIAGIAEVERSKG